jgi:hypothetical protein
LSLFFKAFAILFSNVAASRELPLVSSVNGLTIEAEPAGYPEEETAKFRERDRQVTENTWRTGPES